MKAMTSLVSAVLIMMTTGCKKEAEIGPEFFVGGTVSGLVGTLKLVNNNNEEIELTSPGSFSFSTPLTENSTFSVTVSANPAGQVCSGTDSTGIVSAESITAVKILCVGSTTTAQNNGSSGGGVGAIVQPASDSNGDGDGSSDSTGSGETSGDGDGDGSDLSDGSDDSGSSDDSDGSGSSSVCPAGQYDLNSVCTEVGIGYWSSDNSSERTACSNAPSHSSYTSPIASSASCPFACDAGYLYNSGSLACEAVANADPFLCASNQVMVGIHGRSGGWLDQLGVRCAAVTDGAISGSPANGALNGTSMGGSAFTVDCPAGEAVIRVSGDNLSFGYTGRIAIQCATFPAGVAGALTSYQGVSTDTPFDYTCNASQFMYGLVIDAANSYSGPTLSAYCR